MGRRGYELSENTCLTLLAKWKTVPRISEAEGIPAVTLYRYFKKHGIKLKPGPKHGTTKSNSKFAEWIRNNPDTILPPSYKEMEELTGCSIDTIRNYFYHERQRSHKVLSGKYWRLVIGSPVTHIDINGDSIPQTAFKLVYPTVGRTGRIKMVVRLKDESLKIIYTTSQELENKYEIQIEAENSGGLQARTSSVRSNQDTDRSRESKDDPRRSKSNDSDRMDASIHG